MSCIRSIVWLTINFPMSSVVGKIKQEFFTEKQARSSNSMLSLDLKAYPQVNGVVVAMLAVPLTQNQVLSSVVLVRIHEQDSLHGSTLLQPIQLQVHS